MVSKEKPCSFYLISLLRKKVLNFVFGYHFVSLVEIFVIYEYQLDCYGKKAQNC